MKFINQLIACSALLLIVLSCRIGDTNVVAFQNKDDTQIIQARPNDTITVCAVGDIMLGSAYPSLSNLPPKDGINSFTKVAPFLKGDIVFGNLEGCFLNSGKSTKCKDTVGNSCFAFRMPERYAGIFKDAGFNLLSIANNHVGDFGIRGRTKTMEILDSLNINYAGLQSYPSTIFKIDSVKYAFCAFAPNENTVSINNLDSARMLVAELKKQANIVIVSFHGGAEGSKFEHVPRKNEIFYQENRGNVYEFAHAVIDAGADVVLGHGPHVTRAVEVYKKRFIAYSLGNFCTYGMFNLKGINGIAPLLQIQITTSGNFISAKVISVRQNKLRGLTIDPNNLAFEKLKSLTNTDFPGHRFKFLDNLITEKDD
ncbi:CapA family protein [Pedobacter sp. JCM 36344]|uniref:CapA family protein n=1 Tax=Pedobacter sp. JCM 36344 TaxID=3374280 RepID=UPI00397CC540